MRSFRFLLAALLLVPPLGAQAPTPSLAGRWSGEGTFFDARLRAQAGAVAITLTLSPDGTGAGTVNGARLRDVRVRERRELFEVTARIDPADSVPVFAGKRHLVVLVTRLDGGVAEAEFHLKSNGVFDPRMREGRVTLRRPAP